MSKLQATLFLLGQILTFVVNWSNPENRRLRTINDVDQELEKLRRQRDNVLARKDWDKNEEKNSIDLGTITNRIIFLRKKRESLKR